MVDESVFHSRNHKYQYNQQYYQTNNHDPRDIRVMINNNSILEVVGKKKSSYLFDDLQLLREFRPPRAPPSFRRVSPQTRVQIEARPPWMN